MPSSVVLWHPWDGTTPLPNGGGVPPWMIPETPFGRSVPNFGSWKHRLYTELSTKRTDRHDLEDALYLMIVAAIGIAVTPGAGRLACEIVFSEKAMPLGTHLKGVLIGPDDAMTPIGVLWPGFRQGLQPNKEIPYATETQEHQHHQGT